MNDLLQVNGDLTLNGTVNIANAGGFDFGTYRLINYTGSLIDNGLDVGTLPAGFHLNEATIQTAINNQINLVMVGTAFWNGSTTTADGTIHGGDGVWNAGNTNWTSADGTATDPWKSQDAVFAGAAGVVSASGDLTFNNMQFTTDGYRITTADDATLSSQAGSGIRVDAGVTAEIGVKLTGTGSIEKLDAGTLILSADNDDTGGV
ncbi:hypothetical protein [Lignipirellula cremea]|uniref:Autotransporter-associated beta strand repeat protein n=1 Tax=Lignipirellula cremea TaxID=2528010 RepID=A0A518DYA6_9BACT|nr:hypothetical protein [Lignipirellula cremea]QDU96827.1 hypothetical protein Pla8534_46490 [Lignipirellula cremea]